MIRNRQNRPHLIKSIADALGKDPASFEQDALPAAINGTKEMLDIWRSISDPNIRQSVLRIVHAMVEA